MRADCFAFTKTVEASDYGKKNGFSQRRCELPFFCFSVKKAA